MALKAHEYASGRRPWYRQEEPVIIHSQFVRKDQLEKYAKYTTSFLLCLQNILSFLQMFILKSRGMEQTNFISPMKSAITLGMHPTNHTDFNVFPIDQMMVVWTAVNRVSRSGHLMGADERVTPYQALQALQSMQPINILKKTVKVL